MSSSNRGFTLVEMLIALVIILVAILGLYQVTAVSLDANVKNAFRDEAVRIAEQVQNDIRVLPYDNITVGAPRLTDAQFQAMLQYNPQTDLTRSFRNLQKAFYAVVFVTAVPAGASDPDMKQVQVVIGWSHRNENAPLPTTGMEYEHSITTMVRRP